MYRITHLLKLIGITKQNCAFPEDDTNNFETSCSSINWKTIYNNNVHYVTVTLYNFQLNYPNIEVQITLPNLHKTNTPRNNQFVFNHLLFLAIYFRQL